MKYTFQVLDETKITKENKKGVVFVKYNLTEEQAKKEFDVDRSYLGKNLIRKAELQ